MPISDSTIADELLGRSNSDGNLASSKLWSASSDSFVWNWLDSQTMLATNNITKYSDLFEGNHPIFEGDIGLSTQSDDLGIEEQLDEDILSDERETGEEGEADDLDIIEAEEEHQEDEHADEVGNDSSISDDDHSDENHHDEDEDSHSHDEIATGLSEHEYGEVHEHAEVTITEVVDEETGVVRIEGHIEAESFMSAAQPGYVDTLLTRSVTSDVNSEINTWSGEVLRQAGQNGYQYDYVETEAPTAGSAVTLTYRYNYDHIGVDNEQHFTINHQSYTAYNIANGSAVHNAYETALDLWSSMANITFVEVTSGDADIALNMANMPSGIAGVAFTPSYTASYGYPTEVVSDNGHIMYSDIYVDNDLSFGTGEYGLTTIIHEIGHGLGLKHPGNYNGGGSGDAPFLATADDSTDYSIMSYEQNANSPTDYTTDGFVDGVWVQKNPETPMLSDIAAIQYLYGANSSYNSGNTTITFTGNYKFWAIWDGGGTDTLDASSVSGNHTLDLRSGNDYANVVGNEVAWVAYSANIENVVGGSGNDTINGNDLDNQFTGNEGNDTITGGGGDDEAIYADSYENFTITVNSATQVTIADNDAASNGDEGIDVVNDVYRFTFNDVLYTFDGSTFTVDPSSLPFDEVITGTSGNDSLLGGAGRDSISGLGGNDTIYGGFGDDVISGGDGADTLDGFFGNDTITGGAGNDTIDGGAYHDSVDGGDGDDYILGSHGNDTLIGGLGNDTIYAGDLDTTLQGGGGDDVLYGEDDNDSILGGDDNDILIGGRGSDTLDGGNGNDTIDGGEGGDSILGGAGDDTIVGGPLSGLDAANTIDGGDGNDTIDGGNFGDIISGGNGNDVIDGRSSSDILSGNAGLDTIYGGLGDDTIYGGDGADTLDGFFGNDVIFGGADNDMIDGGAYHDSIDGGTGDDTIIGGHGNDTIFGGGGNDEVIYADKFSNYTITVNSATQVTITDIAPTTRGNEGVDVVSDVYRFYFNDVLYTFDGTALFDESSVVSFDEPVYGTVASDTIDGSIGNDTIYGGFGDDVISGGDGADNLYGDFGNDTITGGAGNDTIDGGAYHDSIDGGAGDDYILGGHGNDTLRGGLGNDTIYAGDLDTTLDGGGGDDVLYGEDDNDSILGGDDNDILIGGRGSDTLDGGNGNDTIDGGEGGDFILGGVGDDTIVGGPLSGLDAANTIDGGDGNDTIDGGNFGDIISGGNGNDVIDGRSSSDILSGNAGLDTIYGGLGDDTIYGGDGADTLDGFFGNDVIFGGADNDMIDGGAYHDSIDGGAGDDTIIGGHGNDTLIGGLGADTITGNSYADVFYFNSAADSTTLSTDTITDFEQGTDHFDISSFLNIATASFIGSAAFTASGGAELQQSTIGSDIRLDLDIDGNGSADWRVLIENTTITINSGDFI